MTSGFLWDLTLCLVILLISATQTYTSRVFWDTRRSNYRTPLQGLYLCGSGAHPGGGVMGAPGRNAARVALEDVNKPLK
jgi:phytoene dehydrogenase-like protein